MMLKQDALKRRAFVGRWAFYLLVVVTTEMSLPNTHVPAAHAKPAPNAVPSM